MCKIRWAGIAFAIFQIFTFYLPYPPAVRESAIGLVLLYAAGNAVISLRARRVPTETGASRLAIGTLLLDLVGLMGLTIVYTFDPATSIWAILYILPLEGALLYQRRGAFTMMGAASVLYLARELYGSFVFQYEFLPFSVTFRMGIGFIIAAVAGTTASNLVAERDQVKAAEEELARINQQLTTFLANLPGIAYRVRNDRDWSMDFISEGAVELTGYTAVDLGPGGSVAFNDIIHPDDRDRVWEEVQRAVTQNAVFQLEYRLITRDGTEKWVWEQGRAVDDPHSGRVLQGVIFDATRRKQLELELARSQRMDAVGRLAGGIAHDFNNLLAVVTNYAALIADDLPEDSPLREDLEEIRHAGLRGANLVRQLLAFSRKEIVEPEVLDVDRVVEDMMNLLRRAVGEHISIETSLDSRYPILIDRGQLEQIIMNLSVNARDAMRRGGTLRIQTCSRSQRKSEDPSSEPQEWVVLSVCDTGEGMSSETVDRIFEPFFTTKRQGEGTGLGLATTYGIVKNAGGWIDVRSQVGKGTTLDIYLPASAASVAESVTHEPHSQAVRQEGSSILVVEDEAPVRRVVERILERDGHQVACVGSASEALAFLEKQPVDLVITDVVMPGLSGHAMVEELRRRGFDRNVIYMSGYDEQMISEQGTLGEKDVLVQKPFTAATLLEVVNQKLNA